MVSCTTEVGCPDRLSDSKLTFVERAIFGSRGRDFILIVSLIAAISTINANLMVGPRILFAMRRDGLMPRWITSVNAGCTPNAALFLCSGVTIVLVRSGSFEALVAITAILFVAVYLSGFVSLFALKVRQPELPRPFKMWGYPWTNLAICLASAAFLAASVVADPSMLFSPWWRSRSATPSISR